MRSGTGTTLFGAAGSLSSAARTAPLARLTVRMPDAMPRTPPPGSIPNALSSCPRSGKRRAPQTVGSALAPTRIAEDGAFAGPTAGA